MRRPSLLTVLLISILLLVGCQPTERAESLNQGTPYPMIEPVEGLNQGTPYPMPGTNEAPSAEQATRQAALKPLVFMTSEPDFITVHGTLFVMNPTTTIPGNDDPIYLIPLPTGDQNISTIPPIKDSGALQAQVDEGSGEFMFINVKPGQYVVVVREKSGAEIPARFIDQDSMAIVTLKESDLNQTIDLGNLRFP